MKVDEVEVVIKDIRLLRMSAVDVQAGGMETGDSIGHVRVLDIPNERMFLVPVNRLALQAIIGQAEFLLSEDHAQEAP